MSQRSKRAFTLIELLVVIAIIAVLAAILFPVFSKVREKGRQTACMSNLRQVGLAVLQYAQDGDENYVHTELGGDIDSAHEYYWGDMLQPYIKNWNLLTCPSASQPVLFQAAPLVFSRQWSYNYGINDITDNTAACTPSGSSGPDDRACRHIGVAGQTLAAVTNPAGTILIADNLPSPTDTGDVSAATAASQNGGDLAHNRHEINWQLGHRDPRYLQTQGEAQDGYPRHNEGFVLVMADGHAKWRSRTLQNGFYRGGTQESEWMANQP